MNLSQDFQQNSVLQELYANTIVGDKLGIEYMDNDIRLLKKKIEIETSNRFAPLLRTNSKHWNVGDAILKQKAKRWMVTEDSTLGAAVELRCSC